MQTMPSVIEKRPLHESTQLKRGAYAHLFSEYEGDERIVAGYWEKMGCSVERLDAQDKRNPDFLLRFGNGSVAICEVKSFGGPETGGSDYGLEYQPFHRLSNAMYSGISQLLEYEEVPGAFRILFFVNHNEGLKFDQLVKMLNEEWDPLQISFRDGPNASSIFARSRRRKVDLYLWLRDTRNSSSEHPSQYWGNVTRFDEVCRALDIDPGQIRVVQAA